MVHELMDRFEIEFWRVMKDYDREKIVDIVDLILASFLGC